MNIIILLKIIMIPVPRPEPVRARIADRVTVGS